jgi:putative transposase
MTMAHARRVIENWRVEYNTERPHSSLGDLTPAEYADGRTDRSEKTLSLTADSNPKPD